MKKILKILFVVMLSFTLIGCEKEKKEDNSKKENNNEIGVLKCDVFECINKLSVEDDVDSINEKLGITGTKNKYVDNAYEWNLTNEVKLRATYNADGISLLEVLFDRLLVRDDTFNASLLKDNSSWKGYDDLALLLGNGGTIVSRKFSKSFDEKYSITDYIWIKNKECYFIAGFYNVDNQSIGSDDVNARFYNFGVPSSSQIVNKGC